MHQDLLDGLREARGKRTACHMGLGEERLFPAVIVKGAMLAGTVDIS